MRSRDRIVTQAMSRALYERRYAGVRFGSNLDDRPCYALFERRAELKADGDAARAHARPGALAAGVRRVRAEADGMSERKAELVGWATLVAGAALLVAPRRTTGPLGIDGQETAFRVIGVSDLVLVPGLLRGTPRWPWMTGRAAFNVGDTVYLLWAARRS